MIMSDYVGRIPKNVAVSCFKVLSTCLPAGNEEQVINSQSVAWVRIRGPGHYTATLRL